MTLEDAGEEFVAGLWVRSNVRNAKIAEGLKAWGNHNLTSVGISAVQNTYMRVPSSVSLSSG